VIFPAIVLPGQDESGWVTKVITGAVTFTPELLTTTSRKIDTSVAIALGEAVSFTALILTVSL